MATAITKETLLPLGMIAGLVAVAIAVGAQNQKLEQAVADVAVMKPAVAQVQLDVAVIKQALTPPKSTANSSQEPTVTKRYVPSWYYSVPAGWTIGPDGKFKEL